MKQRKDKTPEPTSIGDELEREMEALVRDHQRLIDGLRMDWLSRKLKASDILVRRSRVGLRGNRVTLVLVDGSVLKLRLSRPEWRPFATLNSISRRDASGWTICGRSTLGDALTCDVWDAWLTMNGINR